VPVWNTDGGGKGKHVEKGGKGSESPAFALVSGNKRLKMGKSVRKTGVEKTVEKVVHKKVQNYLT